MAAVIFPNPNATNPETGEPYSAGWTADNGVTYIYEDNSWKAQSLAGPAADDKYVNVNGDNMTGNLTLGTDKITLDASNGSATFAGGVDSDDFLRVVNSDPGVDTSGSLISKGLFRAIRASGSGAGTNVFEGYLAGTLTSNIGMDGSAKFTGGNIAFSAGGAGRFASSIYAGGNISGPTTTQSGFWAFNTGETNICTVDAASSTLAFGIRPPNSEYNAQIFADGSATFASGIESAYFIAKAANNSASYSTIAAFDSGGNETFTVKQNGTIYFGGAVAPFGLCDSDNGNLRVGGDIYKNWTGGNSGTPLLAADSAVLWLEPDNPANYTTTTDAEGNETSVYNGPTLDVKDRLTKTQTALTALKAAALDTATDLAGLKAAIVTALADI